MGHPELLQLLILLKKKRNGVPYAGWNRLFFVASMFRICCILRVHLWADYFNLIIRFFEQIVLPNDEAAKGNGDKDSRIKKTDVIGLSEEGGLGIVDAFFASFSMIIVSEVCAPNIWFAYVCKVAWSNVSVVDWCYCQIGDETFIIAALMAMRHPKSIVLSGALTALVVMTVCMQIVNMIVIRPVINWRYFSTLLRSYRVLMHFNMWHPFTKKKKKMLPDPNAVMLCSIEVGAHVLLIQTVDVSGLSPYSG